MKPNRSKYCKNSGFKTPENYFSTLEDRVMHAIDPEGVDLEGQVDSGFKVPEAYFDTLESSILKKIENDNRPVRRIFRKEFIYYAAAAAVIAFLMLGNFFTPSPSTTPGWDDIEVSAMESYLDEGYEMDYLDLSSSDYAEFFNSGKLFEESDLDQLTSEAVIQYLDENVEDPLYIME
ncbi:hypothetical protein [Christiangramia aquimixticola]|uniref:hypothetical protein n=1 Tax=Christiangramia aquimixticola TaxID=1697558 RepID=UPI003AA8F816